MGNLGIRKMVDPSCVDRATLNQWQEFQRVMGLKVDDEQPKDEALKVINQALADRTTLGGTRITEADKMMFGILYNTYTLLTYAEKENYIHLSRWFSNLQSNKELIANRPKIIFSRNRLY